MGKIINSIGQVWEDANYLKKNPETVAELNEFDDVVKSDITKIVSKLISEKIIPWQTGTSIAGTALQGRLEEMKNALLTLNGLVAKNASNIEILDQYRDFYERSLGIIEQERKMISSTGKSKAAEIENITSAGMKKEEDEE